MKNAKNKKATSLPTYTGLKDFARGVNTLYKMHGNIPVFLSVDGEVAPFGIALTSGSAYIEGQEAIAFCAHSSSKSGKYPKGDCTE